MVAYSALRDKKQQLIRKARDGSVFASDYSVAAIAALTTGSGAALSTLPVGYKDLGWTSTDGVTYSRDTTVSEVHSFGSTEPTRSDMTQDTITMQVTAQETKMSTLGMYTGADLSAATGTAVTGELSIPKPAIPGFKYHRVLGLFVDYSDAGEIYMGRYMPRARITALGEQSFSDGDDPISYQMTFTGFQDSVLGYSHRWIFAGPGWLALITDMGLTLAP